MLSQGRVVRHVYQQFLASSTRCRAHMTAADCLEAIARLDSRLNAVTHKDENTQSAAGDTGEATSAIHGMPVLVKDSIDVKGMPTVVGLKERIGVVAEQDAPIVERVRKAGGIILGKTNVPVGCLDLQTFNDVFGVTNNPYDLSLTPGGSTGGGAAAVAAGLAPLALGTDLSGSLRVPASFCGVSAIRPTARRLPSAGHFPPDFLDQSNFAMGAIADSTATLAAFMSACTPVCDAVECSTRENALSLFRPRWLPMGEERALTLEGRSLPTVPTQAAVVDAMERFGEQLESWGVEVHRCAPEIADKDLFRAHKLLSEIFTTVSDPVGNPLKRLQGQDSPLAQQLAIAERIRDEHRKILRDFLGDAPFSAWVLPTAGVLPFPHNPEHAPIDVDGKGVPYWKPLLGYVYQAATCGNPVVNIPIGMAGHLPVGAQVIGRMWEDEELLAMSSTLELLLEEPCPPPPTHVNRV